MTFSDTIGGPRQVGMDRPPKVDGERWNRAVAAGAVVPGMLL